MTGVGKTRGLVQIDRLRVVKDDRCICAVDDLAIDEGERLLVVGSNGSGKTTLLRVLSGLESGYQGACRWQLSQSEYVYVHQAPYMFRGSTLGNAMYGLAARGRPRAARVSAAMQWLERLGVDQLARQRAASLSGGEQRRVALARAFALEPAVLLLDEPFADLDEVGVQAVNDCLEILGQATTIVIASPTVANRELMTRVMHMHTAGGE